MQIEKVSSHLPKMHSESHSLMKDNDVRQSRQVVQTSEQEEFRPISIKELNKRIDQSMQDSQSGRITEASELKAKMEKWG